MRRALRILPLLLLMQFPSTAHAQSNAFSADRMVVLDYSGTMVSASDDVVDGARVTLGAIARYAVELLAQDAAETVPDARFGLLVFGHRIPHGRDEPGPKPSQQTLRSCADIEVVRPPAPISSVAGLQDILQDLRSLQRPKGETPIVEAIATASEALQGQGTVVVVSDFRGNFCGDWEVEAACDRYRQIFQDGRYKGVRIRHILAISKQGDDNSPLNELGTCVEANVQVVTTLAGAEAAVERVSQSFAALTSPAELVLEPVFAQAPDLIPLDEDGGTTEVRIGGPLSTTVALGYGDAKRLSVGPGQYDIAAGTPPNAFAHTVLAQPGSVNTIPVPVPVFAIALRVVDAEGRDLPDGASVRWRLTVGRTQVDIPGKPRQLFSLLAATHQILAESNGRVGLASVSPDTATAEIVIALTATPEQFARVDAEVGASVVGLAGTPSVVITPDGGPPTVIGSSATGHLVLPGRYDVAILAGTETLALGTMTLRPGEHVEIKGTYAGVPIDVTSEPERPDTVWTVTGDDGFEMQFEGLRLRQNMAPGTYTITASNRGGEGIAQLMVSRSAGAQPPVVIRLE